jgi:hypothetical protein
MTTMNPTMNSGIKMTLTQKLELRFWDFMLPLLTRSEFVRKAMRGAITFYHNEKLVRRIAFAAMIGCAGFAFGILAFTIKSVIG